MSAAARPPEGGAPSPREVVAQRPEGRPVSEAVRVGIIGAGYFGGEHAQAIARTGGRVRLAAVASRTPSGAQRLAGAGVQVHEDWRALVESRDLDAVCICTPHDLHEPVAVAASRAGKAVMLEKPMAPTLEACKRIEVATAGVPFMVAQPSRFMPAFALARRLIDEGAIGAPVYVRSPMVKAWQIDQRKPWHLDPARGGGMWMINAIHLVDRLCWLFGCLPVSAKACIDASFHRGMEVDDFGVAMFDFGEGRVGIAEAVAYADGAPEHDTIVIGTTGMLRCHHHDGVAIGKGESWRHIGGETGNWRDSTLVEEWKAFIGHIDGAPSPLPASEARAQLAAVIAARDSARGGGVVRIHDGTAMA